MLLLRKQIEDAADAAGSAGGMDRAIDQMPGFRRMDRRLECFHVAQLADEDNVGILANGMLHANLEVLDVGADLTLVDQALVLGKHEFDRIFEREDVLAVVLIDVVEHRADRRALAGAGDAGQQYHPLIELAEPLDARRQEEPLEIGNLVVDAAGYHAQRPLLVEQIHAEAPLDIPHHAGVGKVAAAIQLQNFLLPIVEHRQAELAHLLIAQPIGLEGLERSLHPHEGRLAHLEMEVASLQLDQRLKQAIDLQAGLAAAGAAGGALGVRGWLVGSGFDRRHGSFC